MISPDPSSYAPERENNRVPVIIGGGAAGYFGAIRCAQVSRKPVILLEKTLKPLSKVRISGGGRCNVTHACFDPQTLVKFYPRGSQELLGPFYQFQPLDTIRWFEQRGVSLKTEEDGRMFPTTDNSETIIDCLQREAANLGIQIRLNSGVENIEKEGSIYKISLQDGSKINTQYLLIASGSAPKLFPILQALGHTLISPVPSLFTFNIPDSPFLDLAGVSMENVEVRIVDSPFHYTGPLLLTHWGLSGPVVLKLSAWGARHLHDLNYHCKIAIDWLPDLKEELLKKLIWNFRETYPSKQMVTDPGINLPKQLWRRLLECADISPEQKWSLFSKKQLEKLTDHLKKTLLSINGKTTYKQEFVTCGGISRKEVNFKTMESKLLSGIYFAGEVLDIDGITGGFNFQNAWTTGWIAGTAMGNKVIGA